MLPEGEVTVRVRYSALNYKDALALTARGRVLRRFPIIPGVELAGEVLASDDARFRPGDAVFAFGRGVGDQRSGGFARYARLPAAAVERVPEGVALTEVVGAGAAAYTAVLCLMALEGHGIVPERGPVVVTGACGGVGGYAVALLADAGYRVEAVTGRREEAAYLQRLGAAAIVDRAELADSAKPLASERWAGGVDTVGGRVLASVLARVRYGGSVAACGNAGGADLPVTVFPFILRAVNLLGIDAVHCLEDRARQALRRLFDTLPRSAIEAMCRIEPLEQAPRIAEAMLAGKVRGRVVLAVP